MKLFDCLPEKLTLQHIFPAASARQAWAKILCSSRNKQLFAYLLKDAESILTRGVPPLPASLFMDFVRIGNRSGYEKLYFQRRHELSHLVLAECASYQGRFLDKIIDYLWDIAAEPTWCLPAHVRGHRDVLPDEEFPTVDLFAAETGMILALVLELLGDELAAQSQCLVDILRRKILERVIAPEEISPFPFWWDEGRNNWTPWCCANSLGAARVVLANEPERLRNLAQMLCQFVENYLDKYPSDGACNEGPVYWTVSPGVLTVFLEQLLELGVSAEKVYADPRLKAMAEFIVDANLSEDYFASFSDSATRVQLPLQFCQRLGERLDSQKLKSFVAIQLQYQNTNLEGLEKISRWPLFNLLSWIFWLPDNLTPLPGVLPQTEVIYYPVTELVFAKTPGLAFAAKGGHNHESHNHNDLGQFILMLENKPIVVDFGSPEYSRATFSEKRFESIITNSFGHNVPSFNGLGQCFGREFTTREVEFKRTENGLQFCLDLALAYPEELQLEYCRRRLQLDLTQQSLLVEDSWASKRELTMRLPLFSAGTATRLDDAQLALQNGNAKAKVTVLIKNVTYRCVAFVPEDPIVRDRWQCGLAKTEFALAAAKKGTLCWEIRGLGDN